MIIGPYRAGPSTFETPAYYVVPIRWHLILPECSSNLSSKMRPDYKKIDTTNYFLRLPPLRLLVLVPGNMAIVACDGKWEPRWSHCNTSRRHSIIIHSNSSTSQQLKQLSKFISQLTRLPNTKLKSGLFESHWLQTESALETKSFQIDRRKLPKQTKNSSCWSNAHCTWM